MSALTAMPVLVLFPHNRCNCQCVMCDIWKTRQTRQITPQDLQPHIESMRALGVRWVILSGGEPQLNPDLRTLAHMLRREGIRITLLTAGLLLESRAADVVEIADDIIVSLDGPPEVHDRVRGVPNAFARLARGIAMVRALQFDIEISGRTTVQKENFSSLRQTVQTAITLEMNSISFLAADLTSAAFNRAEGWTSERKKSVGLTLAQIALLEDEIEALIREHCMRSDRYVRESPEKLRRIVSVFRAQLGLEPPVAPRCNAPWVSSVVEADGSVRPCFFHDSIGNIHEQPLIDIVNGPAAIRFRRQLDIARDQTCRRCVCSLYLPAG